MKKYLLISSAALLALYAANAAAYNGIYLTGEGGIAAQTGLPSAFKVGADSVTTSYSPNALRFGVGYNHDLTCRFGIGMNIGLGWYGNTIYDYPNDTNNHVKSKALEFLAVGTYHMTQRVDIFAKVGGVRQTMLVTGFNAPGEETQIRSEAAIGTAYNFTPHLAATLTYAHLFGEQVDSINNLNNEGPSINEGMLGIRYTFCS